jgi:hypothetical protein
MISVAIFSGFLVYLILSRLLIPDRMSIPFGIIISFLIFGLINYYSASRNFSAQKTSLASDGSLDKFIGIHSEKNGENDKNSSLSNLFFVLLYAVSIVIVVSGSHSNREVFLPWDEISVAQLVQLTASILISFFAPGYAIIGILTPTKKLLMLPRILLAYILSIFIIGITTYLTASLGYTFSSTGNIIIAIQALIFTFYIAFLFLTNRRKKVKKGFGGLSQIVLLPSRPYLDSYAFKKWKGLLGKNGSELIVFGSLIALVVLSTYALYGGVIIGDQWFHHGRALSIIAGTFYSASLSNEHLKDPPFFSAFLAGFFSMSGLPTVNAYAAINVFNIVPVFAFYYFFSRWVPENRRKAVLLASVFFMVSSGFGWFYLLYLAGPGEEVSERASLDDFNDARIKSFDIFQPSSFVSVENPSITTPLIIVALPSGFVLLGLIAKTGAGSGVKQTRSNDLIIISVLSLTGSLAHPEFYLFVITASIIALVYRLPRRNHILLALGIPIALIVLIDQLPGHYFSAVLVAGMPLTYLSLIFVSLMFMLSIFATKISVSKKILRVKRPRQWTRWNFPLSIALTSILVYFYIFTFVVWGELSLRDVELQTARNGQQEIPWYLYPIKLGTCGLLGLSYLISYLFRPFEKEIFVFAIIMIIALFAGPYYDEHRFSKYIMAGLVGLAALFVYSIVGTVFLSQRNKTGRITILSVTLIGFIISFTVISASMSFILYTGYGALGMDNHFRPLIRDSPKRYFPSDSQIDLLGFIYKDLLDDGRNYNVVTLPEEYDIRQQGFTGKIEAFVGIPTKKILQGQSVLEASTQEEFFDLLNSTNTKFIILPKEEITAEKNFTGMASPATGPADAGPFEPAQFALSNFKRAYENNDYVVLSVPHNVVSVRQASSDLKLDQDKTSDTEQHRQSSLRFPGDISERAKNKGVVVPWQKMMGSEISIITAVGIALIVGIRISSRRTKLENRKS